MKILHTSDWHLGQTFFSYDRIAEHTMFLLWLADKISELEIDVLLIAGDLFDSPNPSAYSQYLFFDFIGKVKRENPSLQIIITSGNHDSGARLEAPSPLFLSFDIRVKGIVTRINDEIDYESMIIPLEKDGNVEGYCLAVPYLRQGDYPVCTDEAVSNKYAWGVNQFYDELFKAVSQIKTSGQFIIAMGHLQTIGAELSENDTSERAIIGGMDAIAPSVFDQADYVALGHIHKAQKTGREYIRYSGSPLPMSFAEINYKHGVQLLEFEKGELKTNERILFDAPARLISVPAKPQLKAAVLDYLEHLETDNEQYSQPPYLEVKVIIDRPEPTLRFEIENALKEKNVRLAKISVYSPDSLNKPEDNVRQDAYSPLDPDDLAKKIWQSRFGTDMPEELYKLFVEAASENH
ncbi:MAG: exonuclease SbcCD subunit D [Bacteroidales bacterium]